MRAVGPQGRPDWLPDPKLTPGVVVTVPAGELCRPGYATEARARLKDSTKRLVCRWYGKPYPPVGYRLDHLVSIETGGSPDDPKNLWPEPTTGAWTDKQKDRLEGRLHALTCSGKLTPRQAQEAQGLGGRTDWVKSYKKYVK